MENLVLFFEGVFGHEVAARISRRIKTAKVYPLVSSALRFQELTAGATFVGTVLWRGYPRECDQLDETCFHTRTPWTSAVLEGGTLTSGPVVTPGRGACYSCYRRRLLSHTATLDRVQALERAYAEDPTLGPPGFSPSCAALAAAGLILDLLQRESAGGRVRHVNLLTGELAETRTVQIHGCPRCCPSPGASRYVRHLGPAVEEMLP